MAEYLGLLWLCLKGYRILAHRYRTPLGEIDVIAKRKDVLAFIEIKYRPDFQKGLEAITFKQQKRLRQGASLFLATHHKKLTKIFQKDSGFEVRFDILLVIKYKILHLENYWGHFP